MYLTILGISLLLMGVINEGSLAYIICIDFVYELLKTISKGLEGVENERRKEV